MRPFCLCLLAFSAHMLGAQNPSATYPAIDQARVTEVITLLASDELAGRDTPSPGLDQAAEFIAEQFRKASLEPLGEGAGYFHRYSLPGVELDSGRIQVTLHVGEAETVDLRLLPDRDVRLWTVGGAFQGERAEVSVFTGGDADGRLGGGRGGAQTPRFIVVTQEDPRWQAAAGTRRVLGGRRVGGAPTFLLRSEALPDDTFTASIQIPEPFTVDIPLRNPVGILRGSEHPDEFVIVSSHYDHLGIGTPVNGDAIFNGADDNASGTTAVVVLAEALARMEPPPARSIAFVCFSGEEKGLRGSRAFAEDPPFPLENAVANVNIEMIGRPTENSRMFAWITGADLSDFAEIAGPALVRAGVELVDFAMADGLFTGSDNASLARAGVVAHSISAGTPHLDYHRPSDEVDALDLEHMTAVISGLREVVLEFAQREDRPAYNEKGTARLRGLRRR